MSLLEMQYWQRDLSALAWSREVTVWKDDTKETRERIYNEVREVRKMLADLDEQIKPVLSQEEREKLVSRGLSVEFAFMGYIPEPPPEHIQEAKKTLYEKLATLDKELDSLIDKKATARERSSRLQEALGVATM